MENKKGDMNAEALKLHKLHMGKIEIMPKMPVRNSWDLSLVYTPGVAEVCRLIEKNPEAVYSHTSKWNMVAIVTDGTRILGLGDIGPEAGLPVMEGKAVLFKLYGGVDAFPICLATKDADEIVETVKRIAPVFNGINLEDIACPKCFEVEEKLKKELDIPVFHDDQHGTAVVVVAGLINALKLVGKKLGEARVVVNGAGAAGSAVVKFMLSVGVKGENLIICDINGILCEGSNGYPDHWAALAKTTNRALKTGTLQDAVKGADVLIGFSGPGLFKREMIKAMAKDPIVFACANPVPEISPEEAKAAGARIIATGRSDYPNQVNNMLGFPAIFRGALDARASTINEEMKKAAAYAIADVVKDGDLTEDHILPNPVKDLEYIPAEAAAVAKAAMQSGVAKIKVDPQDVYENAEIMVKKQQDIINLLFANTGQVIEESIS